MNQFFKNLLFTVLGLIVASWAFSQQRFAATVSPAQINKDQYLTYRLIIENAESISSIQPPKFKNFIVVGGPSQESGMSNMNGHVTRYIATSYVLQPRKIGTLNIEPASAVIDGKVQKTNMLQTVVKNASSGASQTPNQSLSPFSLFDEEVAPDRSDEFKDYVLQKGENVADKVSRNMQLHLQTDKKSCYVGEPIVATYKLYTRLKSESKLVKNPSFNGFSVVDLPQSDLGQYGREKLNGKEYNVYIIRKAQLYPLQSGEIELESAELDNEIEFLKAEAGQGQQDLLYGMRIDPGSLITEHVSLSSKPINITVKPLPEVGKPNSFAGAVGDFSIWGKVEQPNFSTAETGKLIITIKGNGNLQLITAPDVEWPEHFDGFEPKTTDQLNSMQVPIQGSKTFEYTFSVDKSGNYTIPAIKFSYFNPATGTYHTDSIGAFPLTITQGSGVKEFPIVANEPIKSTSFLNKLFENRVIVVSIVAMIILLSLFYWIKKENRKDKQQEVKLKEEKEQAEKMEVVLENSATNQLNPLEETQKCLYVTDCVEFYVLLNKEIKAFLVKRFNLDGANLSAKNIASAMDSSGINNETILELQHLMHDIEWQLYTPFVQNEKRNELYERSHSVIQKIIKTY